MKPGNQGARNRAIRALGRVLGSALSWAAAWLAFWLIVRTIIAQPDMHGSGEPALMLGMIGIGLLSGLIFSIGLSVGGNRGRRPSELPLWRLVACGFLGSALQVVYLCHGDLGLALNIRMALGFGAVGGLVTLLWSAVALGWMRLRAALGPRS